MPLNMSPADRGIRIVAAALVVWFAIAVGAGTILGVIALVVAAILVATAAVGFCPLYALLGISTRHRSAGV